MTNEENSYKDFEYPWKKVWKISGNFIVTVDKSIAKKLQIDESDTFLEQIVTENGDILMKVRKIKY